MKPRHPALIVDMLAGRARVTGAEREELKAEIVSWHMLEIAEAADLFSKDNDELLDACKEALGTLSALEAGEKVGDTLETIQKLREVIGDES